MAENSPFIESWIALSVRDEGASLNLALSATVPLQEDGQGGVHATFTLQEDQWAYFVLETAQEQDIAPPPRSPENYQRVFNDTKRYWQNWILQGRYREMVQHARSLALRAGQA